jgi:HlyD family secretion protein
MTGTEIMRISDLKIMEVQVEVSENDIIKVALDDEVEIEVDAYVDKVFKGYVTEIANSASNALKQPGVQTGLNTDQVTNFIVKIRIDQSSYKDVTSSVNKYPFRPGMSASVDIITNIKDKVLAVPIQSVTVRVKDNESGKKEEYDEVVFLYSADTATMAKVVTGIQDDEYIEIVTGVSEGQEVISGPYTALARELKAGSQLRKKVDKDDKKDPKK